MLTKSVGYRIIVGSINNGKQPMTLNNTPYQKALNVLDDNVLRDIIIHNADSIVITDKDFNIVFCNETWLDTSGYTLEEIIGKSPIIFSPGRRGKPFYQDVYQNLNEIGEWQGELTDKKKDGTFFPTWTTITAIYKDNYITHYVAIVRDLTFHQKAKELERRLGRILEASMEELYIFDENAFLFDQVSVGACKNLQYTENELLTMTPWSIAPEISEEDFKILIKPLINDDEEVLKYVTPHSRKDGSWYSASIQLHYSKQDQVFIASVQDVTERLKTEQMLEELAFRDPLTSLYNRRFFDEQLSYHVNTLNRDDKEFGIILIDLDDFSDINNTMGHEIGDNLLKQISTRLRSVFKRNTDIIARWGGDEFIILVSGTSETKVNSCVVIERICKNLISVLEMPYNLDGKSYQVTASVGGVCATKNINDANALFRLVDEAMYAAKRTGKNKHSIICEPHLTKTDD